MRRHCWLFNSHWVELPSRDRDDPVQARSGALTQARTAALTEILQNLDMTGVENLVQACGEPGTVGAAMAGMDSVEVSWADWIAEKGVGFTQGLPMTWFIFGLLRAIPAPRSGALLREVMRLGDLQGWDIAKRVRFLVLARPTQEAWQLATNCGAEIDAAYWASVRPDYYLHNDDADLAFVLQRLLEAKRPQTALQCCQYSLERVEAKLLYSLMQQLVTGEEIDGPRLDSWHLGEMIERIEQSGEIEKMALIQLEFGLFPALGYGQEARTTALYEGVMTEPTLFAELISLLYKPEHGDREEPVTDATRAAAERALAILHACARQPGAQTDGSIDHNAFIRFVDAARDLCRQADRLTMCDQTLGQILAHAPSDDDGVWPFAPAREVLDRPEMEEMRHGFSIGTWNRRGVTSRSPWDGGAQERDLAGSYRSQAVRVQYSHPNVAATLEEIAKSYERDGTREDVEASLRKEGY